jgi:hypothetical protein
MINETRFVVVATFYPDLDPDYDGPALSLDEQVEGITREWPVLFGSMAEAEACMNRLVAQPDPSFCPSGTDLRVTKIRI